MSHVLTVPDSSDVAVTVTGALDHRCPHVNERDHGNVTISWRVKGQTYELHSLAEYLRLWKDSEISHEAITDRIRHDLSVVVGIELLSVETEWLTAGLEVQCASTPTLARVTP